MGWRTPGKRFVCRDSSHTHFAPTHPHPHPSPEDKLLQNPHNTHLPFSPRPVRGSGVREHASDAGRWREAVRAKSAGEASAEAFAGKSDKWDGPSSPAPQSTALLAGPGQAFPWLGAPQAPQEDGEEAEKRANPGAGGTKLP